LGARAGLIFAHRRLSPAGSTGREFWCYAFTAISKKVRQKVHASKPEAQAEGNHVM
jgi:hypothetical protein